MSTIYNATTQQAQGYSSEIAETSSEINKTAQKVSEVKKKSEPSFWWGLAITAGLLVGIEVVCRLLGVEDHPEDNDKDLDCTGSYSSD